MAIQIDDKTGIMICESSGTRAERRPDGRWSVTGRFRILSRAQAITALTIDDLYATGLADDPRYATIVADLKAQLTPEP